MFEDKSKIVFFSDMDGTLLSDDKTVSQYNLEAIKKLRSMGGSFIAATGRTFQATAHYFEPIGLDCPVILCNGSVIYDVGKKKVVSANFLPIDKSYEMAKEILENFPEACAEICLPDEIFSVHINETECYHQKIGGFTSIVADDIDDVPRENWCKILFAAPENIIPELEKFTPTLKCYDDVTFVTSGTIFHEMLPSGWDKGFAAKRLMEIYYPDDFESVAMGDYFNDISMLEFADFSACPQNAVNDVKAVCDIVTNENCSQGAVGKIINYVIKL